MQLNEIIEKIKDILSNEQDSKVLDKDVAAALWLSKDSLSHMKRKNSIPYEQIAKFCAQRKISINWVLYNQLPKSHLKRILKNIQRSVIFQRLTQVQGEGALTMRSRVAFF